MAQIKPTLITQEIKNLYESAGISMATGNPTRLEQANLKGELKKIFRLIDEQDAVNRFIWHDLPLDMTSSELERLLYYKGQLIFWYCKELQQFMITPYTLNKGLDFYGRYVYVTPVPIVDDKNANYKTQRALLSTYKLRVVYGLDSLESDHYKLDEDCNGYCVPLYDYTKQLAETIIPRRQIQEPLLDVMSYMIPYAKTALMNATGVSGMRVNNADEYSNVEAASRSVDDAAVKSKKWIAIEGNIDFQDLTATGAGNGAEPFLLMLQSLDNIRKSTYGIESGGIYDKKAYVNTMQTQLAGAGNQIGSALQDSFAIRNDFCMFVNIIFGTTISVAPSQLVLNSIVQPTNNYNSTSANTDANNTNITDNSSKDYESED